MDDVSSQLNDSSANDHMFTSEAVSGLDDYTERSLNDIDGELVPYKKMK